MGTACRIWPRTVSIVLGGELQVVVFASWLYYSSLVSFDHFPLLSCILISLINLILWLKYFTDKRQAKKQGGWGKEHKVLFHLTRTSVVSKLPHHSRAHSFHKGSWKQQGWASRMSTKWTGRDGVGRNSESQTRHDLLWCPMKDCISQGAA